MTPNRSPSDRLGDHWLSGPTYQSSAVIVPSFSIRSASSRLDGSFSPLAIRSLMLVPLAHRHFHPAGGYPPNSPLWNTPPFMQPDPEMVTFTSSELRTIHSDCHADPPRKRP